MIPPERELWERPVFQTEMDKAAYYIKKYLQHEDMRSREILYRLKSDGVSKRTAMLVKENLGIRSYRKMREWFWTMASETQEETT